MIRFSLNKKTFLGYSLYCLMLLVVLLYYRFPSDTVRIFLVKTVGNMNVPVDLSIRTLKPVFPKGLQLFETTLTDRNNPGIKIVQIEKISINADLIALLTMKTRCNFDCFFRNGKITGSLGVAKDNSHHIYNMDVAFKQLHFDGLPDEFRPSGGNIEGVVNGTVFTEFQHNRFNEGSGKADLKIADGTIAVPGILWDKKKVPFKEILVKATYNNKLMKISEINLKSSELSGIISGSLIMKKTISKSVLNLKGTITPSKDFFKQTQGSDFSMKFIEKHLKNGSLHFSITGTMSEPFIKLL